MHTDTDTHRELALRSISVMADGTLADFEEVLHPEFLNHEQKDEPPGSRGIGPSTAYATALWLRDAFADLRWEFGTGKTFASTQTHWLRIADDKVIEHCANATTWGWPSSWARYRRRRCISCARRWPSDARRAAA